MCMGTAGSVSTFVVSSIDYQKDRERHLYAFRVVLYAVSKLIKPYYESIEKALDNNELYTFVKCLYSSSLDDYDRQICDIQSVYCYCYTYTNILSNEERLSHDKNLIESLNTRESNALKAKIKREKDNDYSQSFSGSAADTKKEKEAAELMKGNSGDATTADSSNSNDDALHPLLRVPVVIIGESLKMVNKYSENTWHKYDSSFFRCFMYLNSVTKEITARRPDNYDEKNDLLASADAHSSANKSNEIIIDSSNGLRRILPVDLMLEIERIVNEEKKTPLIIDCSKGQIARNFFTYKGILEDVSALTLPFAKSGLKKSDVLERCRKSLVKAMKSGQVFALYLGNVTIDHICFKKLCKKDCFPFDVFVSGGLKLLKPLDDPKYKLIFHQDELENGEAVCREGFRFVLISSLSSFDYEKLLEESVPLGYSSPFFLNE